MPLLVKIDGVSYRRPEDAKISVFDHGFLFGDSVYETLRTHGGRAFQTGPHLARLARSARGISLELGQPLAALAAMIDEAVAEHGGTGERYIRFVVTRGVGKLSIDPVSCARPTIVIIVKELDDWPEAHYTRGIALQLVSTRRNSRGTTDPSIKTGNYLNNVLAIIEARKAGADDAVMENVEGHLTESTTSNLFFVREGALYTPSLETGILEGITRSDVIAIARERGIRVHEGAYAADELRRADEAIITSTTRGIMPIGTLDGRPLGDPARRPVTDRLRAAYQAEVDAFVKSAKRAGR
jgi:branched-chain amino acid aminotransferase